MRHAPALLLALLCACPAAPGALRVGDQPFGRGRHALKEDPSELGLRRPGKVVVVAFFATWSEAARGLLPKLAELGRALPADRLEIVGVAIDEDPRFVEPFARELGVTFEVLADPGGRRAERAARIESVPQLVVLDAEGTVREISREASIPKVEEAVRALLATPAP